jgi:biopolymer transport protein ExbB
MIESLGRAYHYLSPGGPVMGLIVASSIICMALIIERWASLRREKVLPRKLMEEIEHLAKDRKASETLALCRASEAPIARILASGLSILEKEKTEIQATVELTGRREASNLERNLNLLGTLAAAGPLLGLLGTVTGMIQTFAVVRQVGVGDPMQLSGGIAEALLNTAGGLVVGIPALVAQRSFIARVDRFVLEMEEFSQSILNLMKGGK